MCIKIVHPQNVYLSINDDQCGNVLNSHRLESLLHLYSAQVEREKVGFSLALIGCLCNVSHVGMELFADLAPETLGQRRVLDHNVVICLQVAFLKNRVTRPITTVFKVCYGLEPHTVCPI